MATARSSRRAVRDAFGYGFVPSGPAWSGRPARAMPDANVLLASPGS
ncbi:hypothetical protein IBT47_09495 [Erwinia sp. S43]|nr:MULTISPECIES: hypothetical protein [unclassified Erwinia]MBK0032516.1 hypothetical protein [Erwinia sp. S43]MCW1873561.1 hypothetical protein [Erwinia sp. INIA01]